MKALNQAKWAAVIEECVLHLERIKHALSRLKGYLPLSIESAERLSDDDIAFLDQLIYRYLKLQDAMGEKLFPLTLVLLEENMEGKPFIDMLNRLERLELIPSREMWTLWRELRNDLTHEYPDNNAERIEAINQLSSVVDKMSAVFQGMKDYIEKRDVL